MEREPDHDKPDHEDTDPENEDEQDPSVFTVDPDYAGGRLDKWLSDQLETVTRSRLKTLIDGGFLTRDGEVFTNASWKLRIGETYKLEIPPAVAPQPKGEDIPLDICFEDEHLIVVNKPAGLVVHPGAGNETGTLVNALLAHCGDSLSGIGGVARPGIVHRIDKDTSGLVVIAKNDHAHQGLSQQFSAHSIDRIYDAVIVGAPRPGIGTVDANLARAPHDRRKMAVFKPNTHPQARHAVTHYKILESFGRSRAKLKGDALACRVECRLETGRTHQIRVHMASIGHPLIGDQTYGRGPGLSGLRPNDPAGEKAIDILNAFRRQALHARVLGFEHPASGEQVQFECAPPDDLQELIAALAAL